MNIWKIVLATVVIFATGVLTGGLLVSHADRIHARQMRHLSNVLQAWQPPPEDILRTTRQGPRPLLERRRMEFIHTAQRQLNLTPYQRAQIEQIVREGQEKTREIMESVQPQLREHWREVNRQIRAELTPAQRKRFDELLDRFLRLRDGQQLPGTEPSPPKPLPGPPAPAGPPIRRGPPPQPD